MSNLDIIRAWKDEQYRKSLSSEERALLPEHPAGEVELSEEDLTHINGGVVLPPTVLACPLTIPANCHYSILEFCYSVGNVACL